MALFLCLITLSVVIGAIAGLDDAAVGVVAFFVVFIFVGLLLTTASLVIADSSGNTYVHEKIEIQSIVEFNDGYFYYQGDEGLPDVDKVSSTATELVEGEGLLVVKRRGIESPWLFNNLDAKEYVLHIEEVEWK